MTLVQTEGLCAGHVFHHKRLSKTVLYTITHAFQSCNHPYALKMLFIAWVTLLDAEVLQNCCAAASTIGLCV